MRKLILLAGMLAIAFFHACRKENATQQQPDAAVTQTIVTVNAWLDGQRSPTNLERNARIDQLKQNLKLDRLWLEELDKGERFIIVPVRNGFEVHHNKDQKPVTHLLLILDKTGMVRKGEIVQYIPDDPAITSLPANTFHALFNSKPVTADGRFVFLSLFDRHLYELRYKDGAVHAFTVMQPKDKAASRDGETCIDWYLITTIYYTDGTHETTEEYVGTTCYGSCQPGEKCDQLDGGTGGANAEPESKAVEWVVTESQNHFWYVKSYEILNGLRVPNDISKFTGISHTTSSVFNVPPVNGAVTWQQLNCAVNLPSEYWAKSTISGKVTVPGYGDVDVALKSNNWYAPAEFP